VPPNPVVGIEFWRVSRKALHIQSALSSKKSSNLGAGVNPATIPEEYDRTLDLPKEMAQEEHDLALGDVLAMQVKAKTDALPSVTHGHRRDCRNPVVPVAVPDERCLTARRPSPSHVRDQKKAAFVQENQVRPKALRFL
jgi:hypothetical protein